MRNRLVAAAIVAILLLGAPVALGHGDEDHSTGGTDGQEGPAPHPNGFDSYRGGQYWGEVDPIPLSDARPEDPTVSDGWIAWAADDGNQTDIVAYNLTDDIRFQVTNDDGNQHEPAIDGSRVVWWERTSSGYQVVLYDLDAGRRSVVAETPAVVRNPTIDGRWVAWQDHRSTVDDSQARSWDIYAYDLEDEREIPVATDNQEDQDPVIAGDHVLWRQREYSQWDIRSADLTTGEVERVTADVRREEALHAAEDHVVFLKQHRDNPAYHAYRYYPASGRTVDLGFDASRDPGVRPLGDSLMVSQPFIDGQQLFVRGPDESPVPLHNDTIPLEAIAGPSNRTMGLLLDTPDGRALAAFSASDLVDAARPDVVIENPSEGDVLTNTTVMNGTIRTGDAWPDPNRVYVTYDGSPRWFIAQGTTEWTLSLDLEEVTSGRHTFEVAAEFPTGPPWADDVRVTVGQPLDFTRDISDRFDQQSRGLAAAILETIPLLIVLVLLVVALVLLAVRTYLRWLRERYPEARYVPPDEPGPPHDNPAEATGDGDDGGA